MDSNDEINNDSNSSDPIVKKPPRISVIDLYSGHDVETLRAVIMIEQQLIDSGESTEPLFYTEFALYNACTGGHLDILRFWIESGLELKYDNDMFLDCFDNGNRVDMLKLWLDSGLEINDLENFIINILSLNDVDLLRLILDYYPDIQFTTTLMKSTCYNDIDEAIGNKKPNVLSFLFQYLTERCITVKSFESIDLVSEKGFVNILKEWFKYANEYGVKLNYSQKALDTASTNGHIDIVKCWFESGFYIKYSVKAIHGASRNKHFDIIRLWFEYANDNNLKLKFNNTMLDTASEKHLLSVLEFWFDEYSKREFKLKYSSHAIDWASGNGYMDVLQMWFELVTNNEGLQPKYTENAIDFACARGHLYILNWWLKSNLELKYTSEALYWAHRNGHENVIRWWIDSDLELKYDDRLTLDMLYEALNVSVNVCD